MGLFSLRLRGSARLLFVAAGLLMAADAQAAPNLEDRLMAAWPSPDSVARVEGKPIAFPSRSPFVLADIGQEGYDAPTTALGTLFMPRGASAAEKVPAVIMLHGAGGVLNARELTYGRQLSAMGVAAIAVDSFGARRDRATAFLDRLVEITETMVLADAYSALRYLATRPEIDMSRVVLVGFSYGGMSTTYAIHEQVAKLLSPEGLRFAGHVAFYAPCIARFVNTQTTGAPMLRLYGAEDEITEPKRCAELEQDLREGGSEVETITYPGAYHQWDGGWGGPYLVGRRLGGCRFRVERDGTIRDANTLLPMTNSFTRKLVLGLCVGRDGYMVGRDDKVRAQSNRDFGRFLARVFRETPVQGG